MKNNRCLFLMSLALVGGCAFAQPPLKHVLYIGLDGCRSDAFQLVVNSSAVQQNYPHVTQLMQSSLISYAVEAGGHVEDHTGQPTFSGPGWATLLTGLWANAHHIYFNTDLESGYYNHVYPTLFNTLKKYFPGAHVAAFSDWEPLTLLASFTFYGNDAADINQYFTFSGFSDLAVQEDKMTAAVAATIQQADSPVLTFVRYANPDEVGHVYGFNPQLPQYTTAIQQELARVERLLAAVHQSEAEGNQWMIVLTTDHGGHLHIHGTQLWEDRATFAVVHASDDYRYNHLVFPEYPQDQTTFLPTIYDYLNLPGAAYQSLYGKVINT